MAKKKGLLCQPYVWLKPIEKRSELCELVTLGHFDGHKWGELRARPIKKHMLIVEGSLEVKLPTIWTDQKQSRAEAERRERSEERRVEEKE